MTYITKDKRELAKNIILQKILPALKVRDLDYKKVLEYVTHESGCNSIEAQTIITELDIQKKIKEIRILTIPDEAVGDFVKELKEIEEQKKQADLRMEEIEKRFAQ